MPTTIPITVFTGFLGAGKTSVILSLLPQLPKDYRCCLLKNEFGDIQVDSKLAAQCNLTGVSEILNGCMCCVLVGQMKTALLEIRDTFNPDRIIIECSGSAFPATLAFQIRELERETCGHLKLDAIVTVIDAENFIGYEDTSPTARMQASYTDLILVNKWEDVSARQLDLVIDHLNTLNDTTPKVLCKGRNGVHPNLIFGLDSKLLYDNLEKEDQSMSHHQEVETLSLFRGTAPERAEILPSVSTKLPACHVRDTFENAVDGGLEESVLLSAMRSLPKEVIWRIKGFVRLNSRSSSPRWYVLNFAFGRYDLLPISSEGRSGIVALTVMGEQGEVEKAIQEFAVTLQANIL